MNRHRWVTAILAAWVLSLGWLVKREVFRPTGARLAAAALAVPPGALFYRLDVGGQQVGYSSTTIDTLPGAIRVENVFVLDVAALGTLHRTTARSITMLSRALRLETVETTFDGDLGQFAAHGRVIGDTVLSVAIVSEGDSQMTQIPLQGPITLPTLLLWGADDRFVTASYYGDAFRTAIPGARFETIDRAGHFPHLEEPAALVERISGFIGARKA